MVCCSAIVAPTHIDGRVQDLCRGNVLVALPQDLPGHPALEENKLYIIDFDSAMQFPLGPGAQPAIALPETQCEPPKGLKRLDPYSWDVYCLGHVCRDIAAVKDFFPFADADLG